VLRLPRCSLLDIAALILPAWLVILITHTTADADLWGHLRFGSDLLSGRGLPSADPYSFTSDVRWINHEWLSEAVMAGGYLVGGAFGLNLLKLAVIAAIAWVVWRAAVRAQASNRSAILLTSLVTLASYTRTQVLRPQLFSVLMLTLVLDLLDRSDVHSTRRWIGVPVLFCIWANLHGAWIVGYAVLLVWAMVEACEQRSAPSVINAIALVLVAGTATAINPYGFRQWAFLRETVALSRADISDWAPLLQLPVPIIVLDALLPALAFASIALSGRWPRPRHAAVILALAFATWRIGRVDAFLQIAIGLLLTPALVALFNRVEESLARFERWSAPSAAHGLAAAGLALGVNLSAAPRLTQIAVEGDWVPDREAVRFLKAQAHDTRLLTWFDWGEYAIWHLSSSGIRVSMDGRRETVYSDRVLADHWAFYLNTGAAWEYPDQIGAERIWVPKQFAVVPSLRDHGWHVAFESNRSIVLSRDVGRPLIASSLDVRPQFFPGE
jgi:hypothetical protein